MSEYRNYDEDFLEKSGHYAKHVSALTREDLHSKSDIAAELAYRDEQIERLQQENTRSLDVITGRVRVEESISRGQEDFDVERAQEPIQEAACLKSCYQCGALAARLSPRSRCVDCEFNRAEFNAKENAALRAGRAGLRNPVAPAPPKGT